MELSATESPVEVVAAHGDMMETQPVKNKRPTAELFATVLPDCIAEADKTPSSSRNIVGEAAKVDGKLAELQRENQALEKESVAVDGDQAEMTSEKEVVLQTRFYQSLEAADLDPDQLETRQRLISLFQKLVEKL